MIPIASKSRDTRGEWPFYAITQALSLLRASQKCLMRQIVKSSFSYKGSCASTWSKLSRGHEVRRFTMTKRASSINGAKINISLPSLDELLRLSSNPESRLRSCRLSPFLA